MISEKKHTGWYFLLIVLIIYLAIFIFTPINIFLVLSQFVITIKSVIPVLLIVFILMALTNYFIKPKVLVKYLGKKSGLKGWLITIVAGIISTGPIYMWYPMLNELQKHGVRNRLIAAFLYNRAIKIPLLPMLILYFGLTYSIVLMIVMIFVSVIQGIITEKLIKLKK